MSGNPDIDARLRIAMAPGLGPILTRRLIDAFGSPENVCGVSAHQLAKVEGIGLKKADLIRRGLDEADVEREREHVERLGVTLIGLDEESYPALLRHICDPPPLLYVRGKLEATDVVALAIVGSRKCTQYGREQAERLAGLCSQAGLTIASGGARGIDTAAHRAALRVGGRTVAVLGCGLARCYPEENADLFDQIAHGRGALISEAPMEAPPIAENFPRRNRIISGMSLGVLVIEASNRSGALITARLAAEEHHREVMALPGRVDSQASAGCHRIVREGWATLVTNPAEIMDCLGEAGQTLKAVLDTAMPDQPPQAASDSSKGNDPAGKLLAAIGTEPTSIDTLCEATDMGIGEIQSVLMRLQLSGLIERVPGNRVKRRR